MDLPRNLQQRSALSTSSASERGQPAKSLSWGEAHVHEIAVSQGEKDDKRNAFRQMLQNSDDEQRAVHEEIARLRQQLGHAALAAAGHADPERPPPSMVEHGPLHPNIERFVEATCPANLGPARQMQIKSADDGGTKYYISVPDAIAPGTSFRVRLPEPGQTNSDLSDSEPVSLRQHEGTTSAQAARRAAVDNELARVEAEVEAVRSSLIS